MRYLIPDSACRIYVLAARGRKVMRESDLFDLPEASVKFGIKVNVALRSEWEP